MQKIRFELKTVPVILLGLTILAYGLLTPWVGFYWDDWNFAWISHFLGPGEFLPAFQPFRPFLGPIFAVTTSIFRESTLAWQIFGLLVRFAVAYAAWWSLNQVWPAHKRQVLIVSLCVLVFPGYGQQWVAFTHVNQELIPLLGYILSFGVTANALRGTEKRTLLTGLALLLMFLGLFTTEYFIGFESLRLLLIWFMLAEGGLKQRVFNTAKYWWPYLAFWLANAAWLFYYYRAGGYHSYGTGGLKVLGTGPLTIVSELIATLSIGGFASWFQIFGMFAQPVQSLTFWLALGLGVVAFTGTILYLLKLNLPEDTSPTLSVDGWAVQAITLGVVGVLAGRIPSFVASLPLSLDFSWDRFMISMLPGACFLLAGLVELLIKADRRKLYVVALLVGLSVSHQFNEANSYRRDWEQQKDFFWQLSWRAPAIKPGTVLLTHVLPMQYESDLSLSAPLNWMYGPKPGSHELDYILLYSTIRLGDGGFPALEPNLPVDVPFRTASFKGNTSATVVIYFPTEGCLKVLDPVYANKKTFGALPYMLTDSIALSDPSRILTDAPPATVPELLGAEPSHGWCYFYEKAELARQAGDWDEVAHLGREAAKLGLAPQDAYEWLPFIEADTHTGKLDAAQQRSARLVKETPALIPGVCQLWSRVGTQNIAGAESFLSTLACVP